MKKNKNLEKHILFGILFGVIIGSILNNMGLWIPVGMLFGIALANYISSQKNDD